MYENVKTRMYPISVLHLLASGGVSATLHSRGPAVGEPVPSFSVSHLYGVPACLPYIIVIFHLFSFPLPCINLIQACYMSEAVK